MFRKYLLIAGTEKSGTTSVFRYLAAHPEVRASRVKETNFFRSEEAIVGSATLEDYLLRFDRPLRPVLVEASPGYLVDSERSASAIKRVIPGANTMVILRDPIERIVSSYKFHRSRLYLPESMSFDKYVVACLAYERGELTPEQAGIGEWFLRVLGAGRYFQHLSPFCEIFPREQVRITTLDDLMLNPTRYMEELCGWMGIAGDRYKSYGFAKSNVTFAPRLRWLQRVALLFNKNLEPFFNKHPELKDGMLRYYKKINGSAQDGISMSEQTKSTLRDYYREDLRQLREISGSHQEVVNAWLTRYV